MKQIALAAACFAVAPVMALAQPVIGPYVSLGAGVNLQQDEIRHPIVVDGIDHFFSFDPGVASEFSIGYGLGYGLRVEVQGDYDRNQVKGFSPTLEPERAGGHEEKWGGFGNVLYDVDVGLPIYPYVGVGLGGQVVYHGSFNASEIGNIYPGAENSQSHGAYAYQGIAGLAFPVPMLSGLSLTLEYRFVGMFDSIGSYTGVRNVYHPLLNQTDEIPYSAKFSNDLNHQVMLGVRYAFGQPPAPSVPPAAVAAPPVPPPSAARTYLVFFDWDRADLSARARQIVAEAASASTKEQTTQIEVSGYTDLSGTAAYNQRLSVRRAESVEAELVRDGVSRGEISIHGYGESNPLVPTAKGVREPQNRRVEIVLK